MPLVRIDLRKGKNATYREAVSRIVHEALVSVGVPKDDRFQVIAEHDAANFASTRAISACGAPRTW
jgi:hypothetical protein